MTSNIAPDCRRVSDCLAAQVRVLNRVVTGIYDGALRAHNVRVSQMNVLVAIAASGPVRATDVCRLLRLEKSTLSRDLDRLLERGLVRSTPAAGRAQNLEITGAGRVIIEQAAPAWEGAQRHVQKLIGRELAKNLVDALPRLLAAEDESR